MTRLRIAIMCLEKGGGISHYAYEIARALAGIADVTCFLASQNEMLGEFRSLDCPVQAFALRRGAASLMTAIVTGRENSGIAHAIVAHRPDIVFDAGSGAWGRAILSQLGGKIPVAQAVHDVAPHPDIRSVISAIPGELHRSAVDAFVGLSDYSFDRLRRKYPTHKCIRSRIGVLLRGGHIDSRAIAERRHKQLFFGRINRYKGIDTLVKAYSIATDKNPALQLSIVGNGRLDPALLRKIGRLGIALDIRYVSDTEIKALASSHGVMILPYNSATQSGVAAIALANGMPSIATNVGALPEQIIHDRNGFVVPPRNPEALAEAMLTLSFDAERARRMAEQSVQIASESYDWTRIAQRLIDDLTMLLNTQASPSDQTSAPVQSR